MDKENYYHIRQQPSGALYRLENTREATIAFIDEKKSQGYESHCFYEADGSITILLKKHNKGYTGRWASTTGLKEMWNKL